MLVLASSMFSMSPCVETMSFQQALHAGKATAVASCSSHMVYLCKPDLILI
jgi:hypothetical protein